MEPDLALVIMEKPKVHIRYGTAADAELLARLGATMFYETFAADNTPEDMATYLAASFSPEKQAVELADPTSLFLIAEIDEALVGYARLQENQPPAVITGQHPVELVRIYAGKAWLGAGVGASLMQACLDEAERRGCDTIWLGVWERNPRGRAFYRKWGFVEVGTTVFQLGNDLQTDVLMQRAVKVL